MEDNLWISRDRITSFSFMFLLPPKIHSSSQFSSFWHFGFKIFFKLFLSCYCEPLELQPLSTFVLSWHLLVLYKVRAVSPEQGSTQRLQCLQSPSCRLLSGQLQRLPQPGLVHLNLGLVNSYNGGIWLVNRMKRPFWLVNSYNGGLWLVFMDDFDRSRHLIGCHS